MKLCIPNISNNNILCNIKYKEPMFAVNNNKPSSMDRNLLGLDEIFNGLLISGFHADMENVNMR